MEMIGYQNVLVRIGIEEGLIDLVMRIEICESEKRTK